MPETFNVPFPRRFVGTFFLLLVLPLDPQWYEELFAFRWARGNYQDIFRLFHYEPGLFGSPIADLTLLVALAVAGAATFRSTRWPDADGYYWLRVLVRYRLAAAMFAYGFLKLFPLQSPFPSLGELNTPYGDFDRWKLFGLSLGIVPGYQTFLGGVEIVSAVLLCFRKTASVGALFILIFLGNVLASNIAYGGNDTFYVVYLILLGSFVLAYDAHRLFRLLVQRKSTEPNRYQPFVSRVWRTGFRAAFLLFFLVGYAASTRSGYLHRPRAGGLARAAGVYNVSFFRHNRDTLPYSPEDSLRWQDVVFESTPELSLRAGPGRDYYSYLEDSVRQVLTLKGAKPGDDWTLHYDRPDSNRIVLEGKAAAGDSVYVVLDRLPKRYLLIEVARLGRQKPLTL